MSIFNKNKGTNFAIVEKYPIFASHLNRGVVLKKKIKSIK